MSRQALALGVAVLLGACALYAPPAPSYAQDEASYAQAIEIICAYDWPCETAVAVAWRESRLQPDAYNSACRCVGWFQIAGVHGYTYESLTDPVFNTAVAYQLWQASGWAPWRVN